MRRPLFAFAVLALTATAARAELSHFGAPGWYQVAYSIFGVYFETGPFADEAACRPTLPPGDEDVDYDCEYHEQKPEWDLE